MRKEVSTDSNSLELCCGSSVAVEIGKKGETPPYSCSMETGYQIFKPNLTIPNLAEPT
jgi:hypothetical protein